MKVLMLGWEFPPHISGGLGTACHGLTLGLAAHRVQVTFVIPRATGEETATHLEIVGCNQVPIEFERAAAGAGTGARAAAPPRAPASATAPAATATDEPLFELLAIDSPLRPYATEAEYAAERADSGAPQVAGDEVLAALHGMLAGDGGAPADLHAVLEQVAPVPGVAWRERGFLPFSGRYGQDLMAEVGRYALAVGQLARTRGFDLVHAHDWMTFPAGIVASRLNGRPWIAHVHATEYDRSGENVNPQVRAIEALGLRHAHRVLCVSHYTASIVRRRYGIAPDRIRVVHNAVTHEQQTEAWHVTKSIPEPIVLFLGRVTFQKGPDYFLEAAARVVGIEPRVKFVMSGSGDMLPRMIEQCARLGLARHVHFTGFLRGKDVERMYAMADIYVMPSVSEPFGISPLEAMALDVPCIVSRQSGVAEVLRNALKFDFWDVEDLANKILALLRRPALARQLSLDGRDEVARIRWEESGRLVRELYEEVTR